MYRVKFNIPVTPAKPANKKVAAAGAASPPSSDYIASGSIDAKTIINDEYFVKTIPLEDLKESNQAIAKGDVGSMYLMGILHIDGGIAGYDIDNRHRCLDTGIELLTKVVLASDGDERYKSLAKSAALKLHELYAGKLADRSKLDAKQAQICLEIAQLLDPPVTQPAQQYQLK